MKLLSIIILSLFIAVNVIAAQICPLIVIPEVAVIVDAQKNIQSMSCSTAKLTPKENDAIKQINKELVKIKKTVKPEKIQQQANKIISKYKNSLSPEALQSLVAANIRQKLLKLAGIFQTSKDLQQSYDQFIETLNPYSDPQQTEERLAEFFLQMKKIVPENLIKLMKQNILEALKSLSSGNEIAKNQIDARYPIYDKEATWALIMIGVVDISKEGVISVINSTTNQFSLIKKLQGEKLPCALAQEVVANDPFAIYNYIFAGDSSGGEKKFTNEAPPIMLASVDQTGETRVNATFVKVKDKAGKYEWVITEKLLFGDKMTPEDNKYLQSIVAKMEATVPGFANDFITAMKSKRWHFVDYELICRKPEPKLKLVTAVGACQNENDVWISKPYFEDIMKKEKDKAKNKEKIEQKIGETIVHETMQALRLKLNDDNTCRQTEKKCINNDSVEAMTGILISNQFPTENELLRDLERYDFAGRGYENNYHTKSQEVSARKRFDRNMQRLKAFEQECDETRSKGWKNDFDSGKISILDYRDKLVLLQKLTTQVNNEIPQIIESSHDDDIYGYDSSSKTYKLYYIEIEVFGKYVKRKCDGLWNRTK